MDVIMLALQEIVNEHSPYFLTFQVWVHVGILLRETESEVGGEII